MNQSKGFCGNHMDKYTRYYEGPRPYYWMDECARNYDGSRPYHWWKTTCYEVAGRG